jgi:hypothetical protein
MTTVTADDIKVLAQENAPDPVLAVVDGRLEVVSSEELTGDDLIVYTKNELVREYGEDVTDLEAELAAADLTAALAD